MSDFIESFSQFSAKKKQAIFKNWQNAKVGAGARTIELSPDGENIFVACNTASMVAVVESKSMKQILRKSKQTHFLWGLMSAKMESLSML